MTDSSSQSFFWHEWLCHSNFSFLAGASFPEDYVERASDFAYAGLALTDYDGFYGAVRAYRQRTKMGLEMPLFYGIEFHLALDHHSPLLLQDTLVLLALTVHGYRELCRLATEAHRLSKREPRLSLASILATPKEHLICVQPMRGLIRRPGFDGKRYALLKEHFGENFYLALSRHLNPLEDQWIRPTLHWAKRFQIPLLFSQDAYFHSPEQKDLSDIMQAIRLNQRLDHAVQQLFVNEERCLHTQALLRKRYQVFDDWAGILQNSRQLAERFHFSLSELSYQYPQEFLPPGHTSQSYLEELVWEGVFERYPEGMPKTIYQMLKDELLLIEELGFADYFLTVWDIVRWARSQQILCQGRGSAANSSVCYVLGITALDPNCFQLLFDRFLSRERGDPPDIDIDFEHERREEVIQYIYRRYGRQRAAMVANVISYRYRGAIRAVGKALGMPELWIERAAALKETSFERFEAQQKQWPQEEAQKPPSPAEDGPDPLLWKLWQGMAKRLQGFPRHLGIHSGGFVITQENMDYLCPQEPATMPGRTVVQWSKDDIEYLGVFKIDVLALGMLSVMRKTLDLMATHYQAKHSLATLPPDDPKTYAMIQRADTVGVFQIESRAQMAMLPRLKPEKFYDLVVQVGIIRPGPIQGGMIHPYLKRRRGLEPVVYPDARLEKVLERTLGIPIFQEQIMRIAIIVGGFSGGEADELRKKIGSWSIHKDLGLIVEKLKQGMLRNHVNPVFAQQILEHLKAFANYGFPEAHSASFALLAYASSYMKCHFPEAFYTSLLNSQPMGFYSVHALVQSARREGLRFLPPDMNQSEWDCTLELIEAGARPHYAIRLGFRLIKSLSQQTIDDLLGKRARRGQWPDLQTFLNDAASSSRRDLGALAVADVFRNFSIERRQAIWLMESMPLAPLLDEEKAYHFSHESDMQRLERDFAAFATTLGQHPAVLLKREAWSYVLDIKQLTLAIELRTLPAKRRLHVFGLILIRQAPETAKGMMFITLEDETGFVNLVCQPSVIARYSELRGVQGFLCVSGRLQKDRESHSLLVEHVHKAKPGLWKVVPMSASRVGEEGRRLALPPARNFR